MNFQHAFSINAKSIGGQKPKIAQIKLIIFSVLVFVRNTLSAMGPEMLLIVERAHCQLPSHYRNNGATI